MVRFPFFEKYTAYKEQPPTITTSDSIPIKELDALEEFDKMMKLVEKYTPNILKPAPESPLYTIPNIQQFFRK